MLGSQYLLCTRYLPLPAPLIDDPRDGAPHLGYLILRPVWLGGEFNQSLFETLVRPVVGSAPFNESLRRHVQTDYGFRIEHERRGCKIAAVREIGSHFSTFPYNLSAAKYHTGGILQAAGDRPAPLKAAGGLSSASRSVRWECRCQLRLPAYIYRHWVESFALHLRWGSPVTSLLSC